MTRTAKPGLPDLKIELAPTATPLTVSPTWVDVTTDLRLQDSVTFNRGRSDERSSSQPGRLTLVLNNPAGNYTPGLASGAYHPLRLRCPIRVSFKPPGAGAYSVMWTGLVDEWSPEWDKGKPVCRISASDRLAQLQRVDLKAWEVHQHLTTSPAYLFALGEADGATSVGDIASGSTFSLALSSRGSGGAVDLGSGALPVDDGTVAAFTPASLSAGYFYDGTASATVSATTVAMSVLMNASTNPSGDACIFATTENATAASSLRISITSSGLAKVHAVVNGVDYVTKTGTTTVTDGAWHQIGVSYTAGGSTFDLKLYVDGAQESTTATVSNTAVSVGTFGARFWIGGVPNELGLSAAQYSGQVCMAAMWRDPSSVATAMTEARKAITGATGETSTARFLRVCSFIGITGAVSGTGLSTVGKQKTEGVSALDALDTVGDAELSPAYVSASGVPTLASRDGRYNAAVALTLTAKDVAPGVSFVLNDQNLVNDVKGTRVGGAEIRQVNTASVTNYGSRTESLSLIVDTDVQMAAVVQWSATVRAEPSPRTDSLSIDGWAKQATVTLTSLLALDVGSRVNVTGLPATAPASTLDLFTEGITDQFNADGWRRTLNTSPVGQSGSVWQLDSATYSVLDSTTVLAV